MAKRKRIDEKLFYRKKAERQANIKVPRKRILIVCEGEKTEPNYFKSIVKTIPRGIVKVDILGEGYNTLSLIDFTITKRDEQNRKALNCSITLPYDEVWAVFDRDSFKPDDFDNAIDKAKANEIICSYSNEAFELWYLLHFAYFNTGIIRKQYKRLLTKYFGEKYEKNSTNRFEKLQKLGNQELAIRNAIKLYKKWDHRSPAKENPSTTVYLLVEKLNSYK
ncbi:MAG: RloB domain-containing protein [Candidatus Marinimicrobia bacterium]|nr:RloB domain-containing protein [Candidatus Neomarinimicrobiota bacterium]